MKKKYHAPNTRIVRLGSNETLLDDVVFQSGSGGIPGRGDAKKNTFDDYDAEDDYYLGNDSTSFSFFDTY